MSEIINVNYDLIVNTLSRDLITIMEGFDGSLRLKEHRQFRKWAALQARDLLHERKIVEYGERVPDMLKWKLEAEIRRLADRRFHIVRCHERRRVEGLAAAAGDW